MPSTVRITAPARPSVVRISSPSRPSLVRREVPGIVGPAGPVGPQGVESGFGSIDYSDLDAGTPLVVPDGAWTRLVRNLQPAAGGANPDLPRGPWANFAFWDGQRLRAKAVGDRYDIKFSFTVRPAQRAGSVRFGLFPNGEEAFNFGPGAIPLTVDAGQEETSSVSFFQTARSRFTDFGAEIYVMSQGGLTLLSFSPEITPKGCKQPQPA